MTWMGWFAVALTPGALVGVWALWVLIEREERAKNDRQN